MGELVHIDFAQQTVKEPWRTFGSFGLVGESQPMRRLFELVQKVAPTDAAVLLTGETGVGKEGLARAVHRLSQRRAGPFVALNCSALSESLIESQLFGHVRGAFTGAVQASAGLFQEADGGTIFLDEVGEMPRHLQPKLLRVLEEKELLPLGSTTTRRVDVRVIAATNQDLEGHSGHFRQDLYYRLAAMHLRVPPLRERLGDIPALAIFLIRRRNAAKGYAYRGIARQALTSLMQHSWPGNVRELDNVLERAMILGNGVSVEPEDLEAGLFGGAAVRGAESTANLKLALGSFERQHIEKVLARASGDKALCARLLGISRSSLFEKLTKWGIAETRHTGRPRQSGLS